MKRILLILTLLLMPFSLFAINNDVTSSNFTAQKKPKSLKTMPKPLEINGHRLPPEPDEKLNNSTLLGIDVNNNGVRDDVERYIYKRFQGFQNAHIDLAIALQYAKATQIIIQNPENAYENKTYKAMDDASACMWYYIRQSGKTFQEVITYQQKHQVYDAEMKDKHFNTKERLEAYMQYNRSLSGHVYDSIPKVKEKCDFDLEAVWAE